MQILDPILHAREMNGRGALFAAPNTRLLINRVATDNALDVRIAEPFSQENALFWQVIELDYKVLSLVGEQRSLLLLLSSEFILWHKLQLLMVLSRPTGIVIQVLCFLKLMMLIFLSFRLSREMKAVVSRITSSSASTLSATSASAWDPLSRCTSTVFVEMLLVASTSSHGIVILLLVRLVWLRLRRTISLLYVFLLVAGSSTLVAITVIHLMVLMIIRISIYQPFSSNHSAFWINPVYE